MKVYPFVVKLVEQLNVQEQKCSKKNMNSNPMSCINSLLDRFQYESVQSAEAVEYTDCISAQWQDSASTSVLK